MKFILNETNSLNERFILTEAEDNTEANETTTETSGSGDNSNINPKENSETENNEPANQGTQWETLYKACKNSQEFKKFWDKYFTEFWGSNAKFVRSLGAPFLQSCIDYGWTEKTNVYVLFLQKLLAKAQPLTALAAKKDVLTSTTFDVLPEAAKAQTLSTKTLRANLLAPSEVSKSLGQYNIVFNPNFYQRPPKEQAALLRWQYSLSSNGLAWANIYSQDGAAVNNEGKALEASAMSKPAIGAALKPQQDIRQEWEDFTGKSGDDKKTASSTEIEELLTKLSSQAKEVLSFLIPIVYAYHSAVVVQLKKDQLNIDGIKLQSLEGKTCKTVADLLKLNSVDYTAAQLVTIIETLATKAGIWTKPTTGGGT
jgi:hypothetical protein